MDSDSSTTTTTATTALEKVSAILGKTVICTLDDGRTIRGKLECLDRLCNIILRDALERRIVQDPSIYGIRMEECAKVGDGKEPLIWERWLSQVVVPGNHLTKVELL